jgi:hypothetical protein
MRVSKLHCATGHKAEQVDNFVPRVGRILVVDDGWWMVDLVLPRFGF